MGLKGDSQLESSTGDSYASTGMLEFAKLVKDIHPGIFVHSIYLDKDLEADQKAGIVRLSYRFAY